MSGLLSVLRRRLEVNARAEVGAYSREFPEYAREAANPRGRAEMLDYAVWTRRRTIDLVGADRVLADDDLSYLAAIGEKRARQGFSTKVAQQVLALHANLMLREIYDAAGDHQDLTDLLQLTAWFGAQGARGTAAFFEGYLEEHKQRLSVVRRLHMLTQLLIANDPAATRLAADFGMRVPEHCVVVVIRIPGQTLAAGDDVRDDLVDLAFKRQQVPIMWHQPDELVALVPRAEAGSVLGLDLTDDETLSVVRDIVAIVERPCRVGTATGPVAALRETVERARRVARAVPAEKVPRALYGVADVFVELGVTHIPELDQALREIASRLANGPDLVSTLDTYYRNDMNRLVSAVALHIHPRTLDYRLQRVRELVGIEPSSVRGVRLLGAAVARALAGAWT
jgi:hypothetical protein